MITDNLISTIITASITGAGLIFVAYSILVPFCEKLKKFKSKKVSDARKLIDKKEKTEKLREIVLEIEQSEARPFYLSAVVYAIFILYILSTLTGVFYLMSQNQQNILDIATASIWFFGIATSLFGLMGITLLSDILEFMRNYLKLKEEKENGN